MNDRTMENIKKEKKHSLPKGWEIKMLSEIAEVGAGNSAPQKKELFINGRHPFIRTSDVGQIRKGFINSSVDNLNDEGIKKLKIKKKGTILFPKSGASTFLNHRVMMEIDGYVSSHLATIKAKDSVALDRYLLYFLITIDAKDLMQDIAYPSLKISDISAIEIPLPPLPEQQRIVAILDETFSAIDKAKANAEQNLKNAKELFESYLNKVFAGSTDTKTKHKNWEEKKLGEVIEYDKNQNIHKGLPFVGLENIESNSGKFIGSLSPQEVKSSTFYFNKQHVLYGRLRPYLNKVLLPDFEGHCSTEIFPIKVSKKITREFLFYWLILGSTVKKINATWTGARMPRANMNQVLEFNFSFPSLKEQQAIVHKLDTLRIETQKLESIYQKKILLLEELKKSILQKAFSGELN